MTRPVITCGEVALVIAEPPDVAQFVVVMLSPGPQKIQYSTSGCAVQVTMAEASPATP